MIRSGRPGNLHLWAVIDDPAKLAHYKRRAQYIPASRDNHIIHVGASPGQPRAGCAERRLFRDNQEVPADVGVDRHAPWRAHGRPPSRSDG
jgi:hypothetical protein